MRLKQIGLLILAIVMIIIGTSAGQQEENMGIPDTDGPKYGGVFRIAVGTTPNTFFTVTAPSSNADWFITPAVEPLATIYKDGSIEMCLAESMVRDNENLTFTIKLKEGIKFHDGSDLNAEVLKWNIDLALESGRNAALGNPTGVSIIDDYTVEVQFDTFSLEWEVWYGKSYMHSKKAYDEHGEDWCHVNMVGTGPFIMDNYELDSKVSFIRNDKYWKQDRPYLDGVEIICITDGTTQASAFINGEIDNFFSFITPTVNMVKGAGFESIMGPLPGNNSMGVFYPVSKAKGDPWNNVDVRKAVLLYGLDWDAIALVVSGPEAFSSNQFGVPGAYHFDETLEDPAYDPEKAMAMLADAGYPDGFSTTIWSGRWTKNDATAIQAGLAEIGIDAAVEIVDNINEIRNSVEPGILLGMAPDYLDMGATLKRVYSKNGAYGVAIDFPEEYEIALANALSARTLEDKKMYLQKASRLMSYDYALLLPTYVFTTSMFLQDGINGFQGAVTGYGPQLLEEVWIE